MGEVNKKTKLIFLSILLIGVAVMSVASAYICVDVNKDNPGVQEFKYKTKVIAIRNDLGEGVTEDAIKLKLKYFSPCNK